MASALQWACIAAFCIAPVAYLICLLGQFYVNVPFSDQWWYAHLMAADCEGRLTPAALWRQFGDHRPVFPKLIFLTLARASRWNHAWELAANLVIAGAAAVLFTAQMLATSRAACRDRRAWLLPLAWLTAFSAAPAENWMWTMQTICFLPILALAGGIFLVSDPRGGWKSLAGACACCVVASYSLSAGMMSWPACAVALCAARPAGRRIAPMAALCGCGAAALGLFLVGYKSAALNSTAGAAAAPLFRIQFVLVYLGIPVVPAGWHTAAAAAGALGLAALAGASWMLLRSGRHPLALAAPYWGWATFAIAGGLLTALGRAGAGDIAAATPSRYITFSNPLWLAAACLAYFRAIDAWAAGRKTRACAASGMVVLIAALMAAASIRGAGSMKWMHDRLAPAREELFVLNDRQLLRNLYIDPDQLIDEFVPLMKKHGLSVFRCGHEAGK